MQQFQQSVSRGLRKSHDESRIIFQFRVDARVQPCELLCQIPFYFFISGLHLERGPQVRALAAVRAETEKKNIDWTDEHEEKESGEKKSVFIKLSCSPSC